jgi:hypothetical protein
MAASSHAAAPPQLTLLSRAYCHLCDDMRAAVAPLALRHRIGIVELDVDTDAGLEARYGERVPVLLLGAPADGIELCHYTFDRARVEHALMRMS